MYVTVDRRRNLYRRVELESQQANLLQTRQSLAYMETLRPSCQLQTLITEVEDLLLETMQRLSPYAPTNQQTQTKGA